MFRNETVRLFILFILGIIESRWVWGYPGRNNGDGTYTLDIPSKPGYIYVTLSGTNGRTSVVEAINMGAMVNPNLPVRMEYVKGVLVITMPDPRAAARLLGRYASAASIPPGSGFIGSGSEDVVEGRRFLPGLLAPSDPPGLTVQVFPFYTPYGFCAGDAAFVIDDPPTALKRAWVTVYADTSNVLQYILSSTEYDVGATDLDVSLIPTETPLPDGATPAGSVVVDNGGTVTVESQFSDYRFHNASMPNANTDTVLLNEGAAPATPTSGKVVVYAKTDGKPYAKDDAGTEYDLTSSGSSSLPAFGTAATKTLASGVATAGADRHLIIAAESGTADDLIEISGLSAGEECIIRADAGDIITVKHNDAGATDKILLYNGADIVLTGDQTLKLNKIDTGKVVQYVDEKGTGGASGDYILIREEQTANTAGGTFTSGARRTRVLNTEVADTGNHASLSSNQITLAAGTYHIDAIAPAHGVGRHQAVLVNVTDTADLIIGTSAYDDSTGANAMSWSFLKGRFTLAATKVLEVQHQCQVTRATDGLGVAGNVGMNEVYTVIELWKE